MKTIGIKLADGSFYPILEEGTAKSYQLDLTTVKDGQTKVQIDLYRSETGTMEDAQYVDTLEVSNLIPHPNGEAELHLSLALNENNELDAKVVDEETGKQSETSVTLVSRTLAERAEPTNFELSDSPEKDESQENKTNEISEPGETLAEEPEQEETLDKTAIEEPAQDAEPEETIIEEPVVNEPDFSDDFKTEAVDLSDFDFNADDGAEDSVQAPQETQEAQDVPFSFDSEIAKEDVEEQPAEDFAAESVEEEQEQTIAEPEESALPKIDDEMFNTSSFTSDTDDSDGIVYTTGAESTTPSSEDFELPDFDNLDSSTQTTTEDETPKAEGLTGYFDDPAFKDDPVFNEPDLNTSSSPAMDFSDLYDKETLDGKSTVYEDEDSEEKKTHVPMIVCIICAIICVIATILVLFVVPSKYNLIKGRNTSAAKEDKVFEAPAEIPAEKDAQESQPPVEIQIDEEPPVPAEPEETAPQAVEDQIVVAPQPEVVVPAVPPVAETQKAKDVKYRIRWGDTLWDIADAYYKNPWRYPKIARYNKIKNPDKIISGTDILIPVE